MFSMIIAIVFGIVGLVIILASRTKFVGVISVLLAIVFMVIGCTAHLDTGYTGIVTTFGAVEPYTLSEGLNFIKPWQDVVKMNNQKQKQPFELQAFSSDLQQVSVRGAFNHSIDPATAMNLYRDVGVKYMQTIVNPRLEENVKSVVANYTAERLIAQRDTLGIAVTEKMQAELSSFGINISDVMIEDIDFTDSFTQAIEKKQVATQEKLRAQTQQEQLTMEAEAEAQRKRIAAESEAEIARVKADAEAYETLTKAEAEAEANKKIAESLTKDIIDYNYANSWNGELPATYIGSGGSIPVINAGTAW